MYEHSIWMFRYPQKPPMNYVQQQSIQVMVCLRWPLTLASDFGDMLYTWMAEIGSLCAFASLEKLVEHSQDA